MKIELVPKPKTSLPYQGELCIPTGKGEGGTCILISDDLARPPACLLADKFKAPMVSADDAAGVPVRLSIVKELDFARTLRADRRAEAYRLEISDSGVALSALTAEGLLRGTATLLQMTRWDKGRAVSLCGGLARQRGMQPLGARSRGWSRGIPGTGETQAGVLLCPQGQHGLV